MQTVDVDDVYERVTWLADGRISSVYHAVHRASQRRIALRFYRKSAVRHAEFARVYNCAFFLSPHQHVIDTYEGTYATTDAYFVVQEYCDAGNLKTLVEKSGGLGEAAAKTVIEQVLSALEFLHSERLVHRNLNAESVLIANAQSLRVKLCGLDMTRKEATIVKLQTPIGAYDAPELCEILTNEFYAVRRETDIWAVGILAYYCLKGRCPWQKATILCRPYYDWEEWLKRKNQIRLPTRWGRFTERSLKFFKRSLNPKAKERATTKQLRKLLNDKWVKEAKSMSDEELMLAGRHDDMSAAGSSVTIAADASALPVKRRSILHQWFAATLTAMTEISEQVVSATE